MKLIIKIFDILIRIIITVLIFFIILICVNKIIGIRREKNVGWTWYEETDTINNMLLNKYFADNNKLYPLVLKKSETIQEKKEDEKRILVVGDSYVWGYAGTNLNYTWWKQLQQKLKKEGYNNITVYGAGTWGLSTEDELNKIIYNNEIMDKIDPDLVIFGYVLNDSEMKDENGKPTIAAPESWEYSKRNPRANFFPRYFYNVYQETRDRVYNITNNKTILKIFGKIYGYRCDIVQEMITSGENYKNYDKVLKNVDLAMKERKIPYFFYYCDNMDEVVPNRSNKKIEKLMKKNNIPYYNNKKEANDYYNTIINKYNLTHDNLKINPVDTHPGTIKTNFFSDDVLKYLHQNYSNLFTEKENFVSYININDSMPYLNINKIDDNKYEFEYPISETKRTLNSNFLYYPIKRNYVKLNLEYPVDVEKVIISGDNLKNVELYVNKIDENVGFDIDVASQKLTKIKKENNEFIINKRISSLNISAEFYDQGNRNISIEFLN